jgi:serine/threonine-protein kinase
MIDGRGRAKITDFGLASLAEGVEGEEVRAGTPAYMAPEQLAGKEVSVKSDLYAPGLVLYELFTGKRAFEGRTASEMMRLQAETTPTNPTDHVQGIDAATERVILRCLERAPNDRPISALAVAAALPGGDPLAAALAAGETPAPEMVANAGGEGALRPAIAVPCLIFVLVGLGFLAYLTGKHGMLGVAPVGKPPQALADRAQAILAAAGYEERPVDVAYGHRYDPIYTRYITDNDSSPDRWDQLRTDRPPAIEFWYRKGPRPMLSWSEHGRVRPWDPPLQTSGMAFVALDGRGRLQDFRVVPPQHDESEGPVSETDRSVMFEAAGLNLESFKATRPLWISLTYCDSRAAWLGIYPDQPEPEIRIEACAYRGRPVYFDIIHPWNKPWRMQEYQPTSGQKLSSFFFGLLYLVAVVGAIFLARRNLRLGRGDRRGGFRLAAFVFFTMFAASLLQADHVGDLVDEMNLVSRQAGSALFNAAMIWLIYLAMEPFVRRHWPESLVSWSRVLAGRFRDPLVGKHLLFGATIGVAGGLWMWLARLLPGWLDWAPRVPKTPYLDAILSPRYVLGQFLSVQSQVVIVMLFLLFVLVLGQLVLRKIWIAGAVFAVSLAAIEALPAVHPWVSFVFLLVIYGAAPRRSSSVQHCSSFLSA